VGHANWRNVVSSSAHVHTTKTGAVNGVARAACFYRPVAMPHFSSLLANTCRSHDGALVVPVGDAPFIRIVVNELAHVTNVTRVLNQRTLGA